MYDDADVMRTPTHPEKLGKILIKPTYISFPLLKISVMVAPESEYLLIISPHCYPVGVSRACTICYSLKASRIQLCIHQRLKTCVLTFFRLSPTSYRPVT